MQKFFFFVDFYMKNKIQFELGKQLGFKIGLGKK